MTGEAHRKLAFYVSVALLNISAVAAVAGAYVWPMPAPADPVFAATPSITVKETPAPAKPTVKSGTPVRVVVPAQNVDLPIQNGSYNSADGSWTLGYNSAYYATPTVPVNDSGGTTLIYAHNEWGLFRSLHGLTAGDTMHIYTDNGFIFRYRYERVRQVVPEDVAMLRSNGRPTVLLQTCSGIWSQYRKLFSFALVSVEKIDQKSKQAAR